MVSKYETSHTLLNRACDPLDEQAWNEFEKRYSVFISYILGQLECPWTNEPIWLNKFWSN